jgi:uncharacterized protein YlzI (FlbEa/FlbD family)
VNGQIVLTLISLAAPDGHPIWLNPSEILELHDVRNEHSEHFAAGTQCLIQMSAGKTIQIGESCDAVIKKIWVNHP